MPENTNKDKVSNWSLAFDGVDDFISIYDGTSGSGPIQFTASDDFPTVNASQDSRAGDDDAFVVVFAFSMAIR